MAPNGATSRKTPAPPKLTKAEENHLSLENLFDDLDGKKGVALKDDVKENLPLLEKPGHGKSKVTGGESTVDRAHNTQMNRIPSTLGRAFPNGKLMEDKPHLLKCNVDNCKRPVMKHAMPAHIERCLNKKHEKQRKKKEAKDARDAAARKERGDEDEEDEVDGAKKTASKTGGLTASKKRKAVDEAEEGVNGPKKKKKKDDGKSKAARPKAPVDVEKQCGVELPQGGQCARSLTCKSHSMGAKRAVPGRSAPYDKLLMEYQRKNQAKLQKAAFDANAPDPDDDRLESGPVDSEEEKDAMMAAISQNWGGTPLYQAPLVPSRKKYEYNRIRGMISSAFGGRNAGSMSGNASIGGSGFFGSAAAPTVTAGPTVDENGVVHPARKTSVAPGARSMMAQASRKPSVAPAAVAT